MRNLRVRMGEDALLLGKSGFIKLKKQKCYKEKGRQTKYKR